ncbi:MAG: glycosyltransferase family 2 protein [Alphaproteobacteria bacterium]|nr:glycosyltransferase family 2 protein [Alphaproteobacteria bacterium]
MPKVSVIVPCYNVSPYIERCLDSLVNQTLKDIEIICVDDCSTDSTLEKLECYEAKESRVKLIKLTKNSGVAIARNAGIDIATGEYIGFVDPDDYVDLDYYEKLYNQAQVTGSDVTVANIKELHLNGSVKLFTKWLQSVGRNKLEFNYTLWCAIYKTEFIRKNKIYNPAGVITSQDTVFVIKCAVLANKIAIIPDTYYNYIRVEDSLSSEYLSDIKLESKVKAANLIIDFLNDQDISPDAYAQACLPMFLFIAVYAFIRTTKYDSRMYLMSAALDLYSKMKYKQAVLKRIPDVAPYLICNDVVGLYKYAEEVDVLTGSGLESVKYIKLFNYLPIIRIKRYKRSIKISLFGIPILGIHKPIKQKGF